MTWSSHLHRSFSMDIFQRLQTIKMQTKFLIPGTFLSIIDDHVTNAMRRKIRIHDLKVIICVVNGASGHIVNSIFIDFNYLNQLFLNNSNIIGKRRKNLALSNDILEIGIENWDRKTSKALPHEDKEQRS